MNPAVPTNSTGYPAGYPAGSYPAGSYPAGYAAPGVPLTPAAPPAPPAPPAGVAPTTVVEEPTVPDQEIRVYGHSNLFYWWPVWVVGFIMAALTYVDGHVMAVVPEGTKVEQTKTTADGKTQEVLVAPPGQPIPPANPQTNDPQPHLRVAANNNYGVIFIGTILLIILITNFTLRGLASVIVLIMIVLLALLFSQLGWWDAIFRWLGGLDVRINAGGYLVFSTALFVVWVFSTFFYDHLTYLVVTRGQVRIRKAIGDGEVEVDSSTLSLTKERNDLFRHWLVGLGSGDLHVKTGGPANLDFELYNVLFVGPKLERIMDMIREKEVANQAPGQ